MTEIKKHYGKNCKRCGFSYGTHCANKLECPRRKGKSYNRFVKARFKIK